MNKVNFGNVCIFQLYFRLDDDYNNGISLTTYPLHHGASVGTALYTNGSLGGNIMSVLLSGCISNNDHLLFILTSKELLSMPIPLLKSSLQRIHKFSHIFLSQTGKKRKRGKISFLSGVTLWFIK